MPELAGSLRARLGLILTLAGVVSAYAQRPDYPSTRTVEVVEELHGQKVADPYRWLENSDDPEVQAWTDRQNELTRRLLDQFAEERAKLTQRLEELHAANVGSTPVIYGSRYFFMKREGLQNHPVLYVREAGLDAQPRVVIDPNTFSADGTVALDWWHPSPDGGLIAYGKSAGGSENSTLYVREVQTGNDLDLAISCTRHAAVAWDPDARGFTYTRYPEPGTVAAGDENYHRHVYYHRLGTDWRQDPRIWGEGRPKEEWPDVGNSSDDRYQFLTTSIDWAKQDLYLRPAGQGEFRPVAVGLDGLFSPDVLGDKLILRTNYQAPRYRVVVTEIDRLSPENWKNLIPEQKGVINQVLIADGKLLVSVMENAYSRVLIYDSEGKLIQEVELPTLGSVGGLSGRPDRSDLLFTFESFAYPPVVFHYNLREHTIKTIDRLEVNVALEQYDTRQLWFNSKDGTRVPMFVTYKKGLLLNGDNPAVLWGYGGFNGSQTPFFYRGGIPWLERGGVWAVANIRGGGEFGKEWHLAGRLEKKQNCFDDFIAAAEKLIADGYTRPERLGARGGSNGGLLTGAMIVQRPDLFQAIQSAVPLLDMLRYQNFSIARLWIPEYGSAEDPEQFKFLYPYSPYHHVEKGVRYPAVLLTTAENDSRVDPMHARKMAASLQAATGSDRPVLLWVETKAGHGAGKPLSKYIEQQVDAWTFFLWQLGVIKPPAATSTGADS
jgi:prolyl oligopeptidase